MGISTGGRGGNRAAVAKIRALAWGGRSQRKWEQPQQKGQLAEGCECTASSVVFSF